MNVKRLSVNDKETVEGICLADIFKVKGKKYCRCVCRGEITLLPMDYTPTICPSCNRQLSLRDKGFEVPTRLMRQVYILGGWTDLDVVETEGEEVKEGHAARIIRSMGEGASKH